MVFTWCRVRSLLRSWSAAGTRAGARHNAHIPDVAAAVLEDLTSAHFKVTEVSEFVDGCLRLDRYMTSLD